MGSVVAPSEVGTVSVGPFLAPSESRASQWDLRGSGARELDAIPQRYRFRDWRLINAPAASETRANVVPKPGKPSSSYLSGSMG